MDVMKGKYNKLLYMGRDGVAYFSMFVSKTPLPYESTYSTYICSGRVPEYNRGYPLTLHGHWTKSNKWKFEVESFEEDLKEGYILEEYLMQIDGVGAVSAKKLAGVKDIWNYDIYNSELLAKETGLSNDLCETVISTLNKQKGRYDLYCYLCQYGITDIKVDNIIEAYGNKALQYIKDNPYDILRKYNISFAVMDEIGFAAGLNYYNLDRLDAMLHYAMDLCTKDGSTFVLINDLIDKMLWIAQKSIYGAEIPDGFLAIALSNANWLYVDKINDRVYLKEYWYREYDIARGVARLENTKTVLNISEKDVNWVEKKLNITYASSQKNAFNLLSSTGVKVLTGGPGTGKTTLINGILTLYKEKYPDNKIALCAPTGVAGEHMAESTNFPASTIHRLLEYQPFSDEEASYKDMDDPIDADFIIMDETSMTDTKLMGMFFNAIQSGSLVLLCGDIDQLDSVCPGAVLRDIINSKKVDVYRLDTLFRQKQGSTTIINKDKVKIKDCELVMDNQFQILRYNSGKEIDSILTTVLKKENNPQILTTPNKGAAGVYALNHLVQSSFQFEGREIHRNGYVFHKNDKIMMIVNNYKAGYFNGDIGKIISITAAGTVTIQIGKKTIVMEHTWLEDMVLAYAITIHKSQGNEFDTAIIVLPQNPEILLNKHLIYTAITRAKSKVIILSQGNALEKAIMNDARFSKKTGLKEKICITCDNV